MFKTFWNVRKNHFQSWFVVAVESTVLLDIYETWVKFSSSFFCLSVFMCLCLSLKLVLSQKGRRKFLLVLKFKSKNWLMILGFLDSKLPIETCLKYIPEIHIFFVILCISHIQLLVLVVRFGGSLTHSWAVIQISLVTQTTYFSD